ncbi:hypothetical protein QJQ45_005024 [Haematococcus lacustris]|nr:hypothetical protein QJQ45_005024 [Haematococcus lacustris]
MRGLAASSRAQRRLSAGAQHSNICRSPAAEAVFSAAVQRAGLAAAFDIDSCGTGGGNPDWYLPGGWSYHTGDPSDERMTAAAAARGVRLTSRSRPLEPLDLSRFDYVICMEARNTQAVQKAADSWSKRGEGPGGVPGDYRSKLSLMTDYCVRQRGAALVPDPYYSGSDAFNKVLDLLEDACDGLLQHIRERHQL